MIHSQTTLEVEFYHHFIVKNIFYYLVNIRKVFSFDTSKFKSARLRALLRYIRILQKPFGLVAASDFADRETGRANPKLRLYACELLSSRTAHTSIAVRQEA
jgi:hypothetical protein